MSALRPAFFIPNLESFISRLNVIPCHDLTFSVRFVTENIMFRKVRQDDFEKFMTVKHKKSYYLAQIEVYLTFLLKRCPFYAAASVTA